MFSAPCRSVNFNSLSRLNPIIPGLQSLRKYAGKKCGKQLTSKCGTIINDKCGTTRPTVFHVPKPPVKKPPLVSMWKIKDCEPSDICVLDLRYDMKYYSISDKRKRKYQITWNECPRLLIKPKKVCVYDKIRRPKIKRRKRRAVAKGSKVAKKGKCVYITAPCCKVGRRPPKCKSAFPSLGNCEKRKTPYPSFSECKKDPMIPLPPVECRCLDLPALCDAWAILRRRIARGKKPIKKCGEV
ncbi:uncharacterized protein LOC6560282 [Drosophila grimshawi]|uniref:GH20817 n=1 Tax=Drosophila grimshawi TaxID=7222 RepID=B4J5W0_DROGR|nr:uncharacterized protein LOC6560282 [Drosophila grimshawi]EDW00803.1 GH20817 [Drosophila grimshawi]